MYAWSHGAGAAVAGRLFFDHQDLRPTTVLVTASACARWCGYQESRGCKMNLTQELENLEQLRNRGALSEAEFVQAKARLL